MATVIVIFASNFQAEMPQMGASDRAAIGLAVSRFTDPVAGFCPQWDHVAANYGAAANIVKVEPLSFQIPVFDIAIVGQSALSEFGDELAGDLAEKRRATLVFDVLDVHRDGNQLRIVKDIGQGNREECVLTGAVVMVISANAVRPPYVSRYRRMIAARNRNEIEIQTGARPASEWETVRPRVKASRGRQAYDGLAEDRMSAAFGISAATSADVNDRLIVADAATCAHHLLRYLAHHGFLPAGLGKAPPEREEKLPAARSSKLQAILPDLSRGSLSRRAARAPRIPSDSLQRMARRPRVVQAGEGQPPVSASLLRCPRPIGRLSTGIARRPRRLND